MSEASGSYSAKHVIVVGVLIIVLFWLWCWLGPVKWCPFCKPCAECEECVECENATGICSDGSSDVQIVQEDTHSAVWMATDNSWILNAGAESVCTATGATDLQKYGQCMGSYESEATFRTALMWQLGEVHEPAGETEHFEHVELTFNNDPTDTETLTAEVFDWLDINATDECPIDAFHAYALFDNSTQIVECDSATASHSTLSDPSSCLRGRWLHAAYEPNIGVITYWPDAPGYYGITVQETSDSATHSHVGYTFSLCDPVTIDQWKDGCWVARHTGVTEVRIVYKPGPSSTHNKYHLPPMNGGGIGP